MRSVLFSIGRFNVYGYGFMIAIGIIACVGVAMYRAKRYGIDPDLIFNCALIGIVFGFIGSKITYWLVEIDAVIENPKMMLDIGSGFVAYGGIIAGILAAWIYVAKIKKQSFLDKLDLAAPSIALGQGIGRIGCFLGGCCYGKPTGGDYWYGVTFPEGSLAPAGIQLYPTQIVSAIGLVLIFFLLVLLTPNNKFRGQITALYMIVYSVCRFVIEFFRGDDRGFIGPFSTSQFIGIFVFLAGVVLYFVFRKKAMAPIRLAEDREEEAEDAAGEAEEAPEEEPEVTPEAAEEAEEKTAEGPEETPEEAETAKIEETKEKIEEAEAAAEQLLYAEGNQAEAEALTEAVSETAAETEE